MARYVFFLGTGGAGILMQPALQLLSQRSTFGRFGDFRPKSSSAAIRSSARSPSSVMPSLSGTTKESIAALEYCRQRGARVVALVGHADTPLGRGADHALVNFAEDDTSCESFYLQSLLIALSIMNQRGEFDGYAAVVSELQRLPALLVAVKRAFEARAERFAEQHQGGRPYHILTGAGSTWPEAFYYGMCILEEMQWIRTRPVHAADFFHGTLELLDKDVRSDCLQGRGCPTAAGGPRRGFRAAITPKSSQYLTARLRSARDRHRDASTDIAGSAGDRPGAGQRPPGDQAQSSAHDAPILQAGALLKGRDHAGDCRWSAAGARHHRRRRVRAGQGQRRARLAA